MARAAVHSPRACLCRNKCITICFVKLKHSTMVLAAKGCHADISSHSMCGTVCWVVLKVWSKLSQSQQSLHFYLCAPGWRRGLQTTVPLILACCWQTDIYFTQAISLCTLIAFYVWGCFCCHCDIEMQVQTPEHKTKPLIRQQANPWPRCMIGIAPNMIEWNVQSCRCADVCVWELLEEPLHAQGEMFRMAGVEALTIYEHAHQVVSSVCLWVTVITML